MDKYLGYSDLIIDKDCNDNMCAWKASLPVSAPTIDSFSSSPNNYIYAIGIFVCILIIILFGLNKLINKDITILKKYKSILQYICKFTALSIVIQVIIAIFLDMTEDYSICYYESSCFIINNTLHSSKIWYRLTNKECPDDIFGIFDTFQYYYGNFGKPNYVGSSCSESEYGCCHYNNQCSFAMESSASRNYMSRLSLYNEYITNNNGYTYSQVWKEDDNGSNCLPIEDIIIKNVYGSDHKHYTNTIYLIIIYCIAVIIIICIYGIFDNKGKPRVHFVDLETGPIVGTSDEEGDSFTDPHSRGAGYQLSTRQQQEREEFLKSKSHKTDRSTGSPPTQQNLKASC